MKYEVKKLVENGARSIEEIAETLQILPATAATYVAWVRQEKHKEGKTIVTCFIKSKTYISVQPLSLFNI